MKLQTKAPVISEAHIQQTCTEWLELDGWRSLRTDPVRNREWGKGFGELGMADHLYIRYDQHPRGKQIKSIWCKEDAEVMWIEWKRIRAGRKKATKTTLQQDNWHAAERARGALTMIAGVDFPATIEGFQDWYLKSGLMRKNLR